MNRRARWLARAGLAEEWGVPQRVKLCGRRRYQRHVTIKAANGSAWFEGVLRCRTRICPVCWVARRAVAAREIGHVFQARGEQTGNFAMLATLTVRHAADDPVAICREVRRCWQKFCAGREFVRFRESQALQWVAAEEVTRGRLHGWHPHMHLLLMPATPQRLWSAGRLLDAEQSALAVAARQAAYDRDDSAAGRFGAELQSEHAEWWHERWARIVRREMGAAHEPSRDHGVDLRPCGAAEYLSKLGFELADAGVQKGRAPLALLNAGEVKLYLQLQNSRHRCRDITFSRGLRPLRDSMPENAEAEDVLTLRGSEYERLAELGTDTLIDVLEASTAGEKSTDFARSTVERWIGPIEGYDPESEALDGTRLESAAAAAMAV